MEHLDDIRAHRVVICIAGMEGALFSVLTGLLRSAIIAVPTAIAGIYGMNFDDMPELHWTFGYPTVLLIMLTICFFLYRQFKKSGWL